MYIEITKAQIHPEPDQTESGFYYAVRFQPYLNENIENKYHDLCILIKLFDRVETSNNLVEAITNLKESTINYIHSLGIDSSGLFEEIRHLCDKKLSEVQNLAPVKLKIRGFYNFENRKTFRLAEAYIDDNLLFNIHQLYPEYSEEINASVPETPIVHIQGMGDSQKDALEDLLNNCERYESAIHRYVEFLTDTIKTWNKSE